MDVNEGKSAPRRETGAAGDEAAPERSPIAFTGHDPMSVECFQDSPDGEYVGLIEPGDDLAAVLLKITAHQDKHRCGPKPEEAQPTVTVTLVSGQQEAWQASMCGSLDGALLIGDPDSCGSMVPVATWAPGEWKRGGREDKRQPPAASDRERLAALELLEHRVSSALFASGLDDGERLAAIKQARDKHHGVIPE